MIPRTTTRNRGVLQALSCLALLLTTVASAWVTTSITATSPRSLTPSFSVQQQQQRRQEQVVCSPSRLYSSSTEKDAPAEQAAAAEEEEELPIDYDEPEDAVIHVKPRAMRRLRELRAQQQQKQKAGQTVDEYLVLRMGVRNGGCSGMSYVMDFDTMESVNEEDDTVDTYQGENIQCVVDSKSLLYLYGLELDYSDALVGGGFKFYNPNAEESCGCGSSFGV